MLEQWFTRQWQRPNWVQLILLPLSWLFAAIVWGRRFAYRQGWLNSTRLPVPVIVVGNITVGGVGKTPIVASLVNHLQAVGYHPGIVSRGYGRRSKETLLVNAQSNAQQVGDEPLLLVRKLGCPVVVGANRVAAAHMLLREYPQCNVIIADDGLQHYRLQRNIEVAVINTDDSGWQRGALLPAGALREPLSRLTTVDCLVNAGASRPQLHLAQPLPPLFYTNIVSLPLRRVDGKSGSLTLDNLRQQKVVAICAIGNPQRFFNQIAAAEVPLLQTQAFPDHHSYQADEIHFADAEIILMTEKDAVKCQNIAGQRHWYWPIEVNVDDGFAQFILKKLKDVHG